MSAMIERVARAICCPEGCNGDTGSGRPCDIEREDKTSMQQARAAIKAMREPNKEMMAAVDCAGTKEIWWNERAWLAGYHAMIDAALSSQDGKA